MKDENFAPAKMTAEEKAALLNFQERINTDTGELEPEKNVIQTAKIMEVKYSGGISNEDYHNSEKMKFCGVPYKSIMSSGKLKACKTPLHLKKEIENPPSNREAFNTGSAFHSMILEPEKFEYELFDDTEIYNRLIEEGSKSPRATKEYKTWFAKYQDEDGNLRDNVLRKEAFQSMWTLKKKLNADKVVKDLFEGSQPEHSVFVKFDYLKADDTYLVLKVRPDGLKLASRNDAVSLKEFGVKFGDLLIISVKTTVDASPSGFLKQCIRLGYNITEAFYYDMIERWARHINLIGAENSVKTIFLTLEKDGNNLTGHYLLRPATQDFIQWGRYDYTRNLNTYISTVDMMEGYEAINNGSTICEISAPWRYGN